MSEKQLDSKVQIASTNPFTGERVEVFSPYSDQNVGSRLDVAVKGFEVWRKTTFSTRARKLKELADLLVYDKQKLADLITLEMGKLQREAIAEIEKCAAVCHYYAERGDAFLQDQVIESDAGHSAVKHLPLGVILAVMPWNFPFWQVFRFLAPVLMAGNVGVLKHASNVPQCALAIQSLVEQVGFPQGVFQTLLMESARVEKVIADKRIRGVAITGSEKAGRAVAAAAGYHLKPCVLELGGSDPFIVLNDADLNTTVDVAVKSRFMNAGQSCIAAKRFIVQEGIYESFCESFFEALKKLKMGDPKNEETTLAPMASHALRDELIAQVRQARQSGARSLLDIDIPSGPAAFFSPSVLSEVDRNNPVYQQELFGPAAILFKVKNDLQALQLANDSRFGLASSVWSADQGRAQWFADQIEAGSTFINGLVKSDPRLPFGGVKESGFGRELSELGIKEFVNCKTIWQK